MSGKGDKDRTRDFDRYRDAPIWDKLKQPSKQRRKCFNDSDKYIARNYNIEDVEIKQK